MPNQLSLNALQAVAYAGLGGGLGAVGAAWITARAGRDHDKADAAAQLTKAASALTDRLVKRNADLSADNGRLRRTLLDLIERIDVVVQQSRREVTDDKGPRLMIPLLYALEKANDRAQRVLAGAEDSPA